MAKKSQLLTEGEKNVIAAKLIGQYAEKRVWGVNLVEYSGTCRDDQESSPSVVEDLTYDEAVEYVKGEPNSNVVLVLPSFTVRP